MTHSPVLRGGPAVDALLAGEGAFARAEAPGVVLLHSSFHRLPDRERRLVLLHELAHLEQLARPGNDPTRLLEPYAGPLLLEVLTVCYALYYFHPIVLGALLWRDDLKEKKPGARFPAFAFAILLTFYVSYAGYFLVPAIGPRFTVRHDGPLPRATVAAAIDGALDRLESSRRNCFPSGHTMVTVAVLVEAARRSRTTFLGFLPFAAGLVAATVVGRYHYVVDVLAGLVLTIAVLAAARAVSRKVVQEPDGTVLETSRYFR